MSGGQSSVFRGQRVWFSCMKIFEQGVSTVVWILLDFWRGHLSNLVRQPEGSRRTENYGLSILGLRPKERKKKITTFHLSWNHFSWWKNIWEADYRGNSHFRGGEGEQRHKWWWVREILWKKIKKTCQNKSITNTSDFPDESEDKQNQGFRCSPKLSSAEIFVGLSWDQNAVFGSLGHWMAQSLCCTTVMREL